MSAAIIVAAVLAVIVAVALGILVAIAVAVAIAAALLSGAAPGGNVAGWLAGVRALLRLLPKLPTLLPAAARAACTAAAALGVVAAALRAVQSAGHTLAGAQGTTRSVPTLQTDSLWNIIGKTLDLGDHAAEVITARHEVSVLDGLGTGFHTAGAALEQLDAVRVQDLDDAATVLRTLADAIAPGSCPPP